MLQVALRISYEVGQQQYAEPYINQAEPDYESRSSECDDIPSLQWQKTRKQVTQHVRSVYSDADDVSSISSLSDVPGTESPVAPTVVPPKPLISAQTIVLPFLFTFFILIEMRFWAYAHVGLLFPL